MSRSQGWLLREVLGLAKEVFEAEKDFRDALLKDGYAPSDAAAIAAIGARVLRDDRVTQLTAASNRGWADCPLESGESD